MARDIKQLHPRLQQKVAELKVLCEKEGLVLGIGECFRSVAEQDELYAQGRTTSGSIVTNAKGSTYSSQHQWGIAFDFFKNVKGHAYDDAAFFSRVGALAKSIGLAWGGDWSKPDRPHLYLPDWGSTPTKLKEQYGTFENFKKTWTSEVAPQPITKKSVDEVAEEVLHGVWGNGNERINRLTEAGYNYKEVQAKVNAMLSGKAPIPTPTPTKSLDDWAKEIIDGKHGTGHANREASLKKAGCPFAYADVRARVNALCGSKATSTSSPYYPKYTGKSNGIDTVLRSVGVPETFLGNWKNRKTVASKNGIKNYTGTAKQNLELIALAKNGKLKRV